jgi:APA family basic amino acid/polyamine antiporter
MASLFVTKPVERLIAETQDGERSLRRVLGPIDLIALGIRATMTRHLRDHRQLAAGDAARPLVGPDSVVRPDGGCVRSRPVYAGWLRWCRSGSAYTFAYVTLGGHRLIVADLIIE